MKIQEKKSGLRAAFTSIMLMLIAFTISAKQEEYSSTLTGAAITTNAVLTKKDALYHVPTPINSAWVSIQGIRYQDVKNVITLKVDHTNLNVIPNFTVNVELLITYRDVDGALQTISTNPVLTVSHSSSTSLAFKDINAFTFTGGHLVDVTIQNISTTPASANIANLVLENKIIIERYFDFDKDIVPTGLTIPTNLNAAKEIEITWPVIQGAEEYQLEWLHVNNYDGATGATRLASELKYDFSRNATRISTTGNSYKVAAVFEQGYVLFRFRALTIDGANNNLLIPGKWSAGANCSPVLCNVSTHSTKFEITAAHETDKFNWQYSASYAEEGKKKESVSYFDGSLRNQQVVSKINSDNQAIVGETYYDHQGRAAIQVLPAPANSPVIGFYNNFNTHLGVPYSREHFDLNSGACSILAKPMDPSSGTSKYYSPQNPDKQDHQAFVPDALSYPFTHVEHEGDNSGRIRRQGGVGPDHQLGSGH